MAAPHLPPGPRGHFLIGSLPEFKRDMTGFLAQCMAEYGDMCWFTIGPLKVCLLSNPDLIREVLQDRADEVIKPWGLRQLKVAMGEGLLTAEGAHWRGQRKLIQPAFHNDRVRAYGEIMVRRGEEMLARWRDGETRDIHVDCMKTALAVVAESLFGMDFSEDAEAAMQTALEHFMEQFERLLNRSIPLPLSWPTPANLRLHREVKVLRGLIEDVMRARRADNRQGEDLLSWLLAAQADSGMSDTQIVDEVITLLMAGHETTAATLSTALMLVAQHPEVEAKLLAELDAVLGERAPTPADVPELNYARQILQETMRLYPAAWAMSREALSPFALGGYTLPKGTQILISQFAVHRNARYFPEPDRFQPERWEEGGRGDNPKYAYFPFGGGPRFCIGSNFAMMEATLLLAMSLRRFRIEIVPGFELALQPSITLRPRHGIQASVHARTPALRRQAVGA